MERISILLLIYYSLSAAFWYFSLGITKFHNNVTDKVVELDFDVKICEKLGFDTTITICDIKGDVAFLIPYRKFSPALIITKMSSVIGHFIYYLVKVLMSYLILFNMLNLEYRSYQYLAYFLFIGFVVNDFKNFSSSCTILRIKLSVLSDKNLLQLSKGEDVKLR